MQFASLKVLWVEKDDTFFNWLYSQKIPDCKYDGRLRTICTVEDGEGEIIERDISSKIGPFKPCHLTIFPEVRHLDISQCFDINVDEFIKYMGYCDKVRYLTLGRCNKFTEEQILEIVLDLEELEVLDCTSGCKFHAKNVHMLVFYNKRLRMINVEVAEPKAEIKLWEELLLSFPRVSFGASILEIFPNNGREILMKRLVKSELF